MNTSDTSMSLVPLTAYTQSGSDPSGRSAHFAQGISESLSTQLQCLKKGGESGDTTIQSTMTSRVQSTRGTASVGIESDDTTTRTTSHYQPPVTIDEEGSQGLPRVPVPEGKQQGTIKEVTPVALRTRSCRHQTDSIRIEEDKGDNGNTNRNVKDKELIRQLWKKTKEQQDTIDELSSAVKEFLKVQPCVKKLQGNIAKIHKQVESRTFKVTVPISGPQIVKPFTPTEYMPADIPEEEYFASKAPCKHTAFMATPVKRSKGTRDYDSPEDSRDFDSTPKSEPSDTRSEDSEAKSESSNQSFNSWVKSLDIRRGLKLETSITSSQDVEPEDSQQVTSGSCFEDNSCELQEEEPERPHHRIYRKESKKRKFVFPKRPKEERSAAGARIQAALEQVPNSVHLNSRGKRDTATLYVGNIDYNASEQDLSNALDKIFKRIHVEKVTIPRVNGRSMYGFIEISWARGAPVKASDLCIHNSSGRVTVNGRPIYFRESCGKEDSE